MSSTEWMRTCRTLNPAHRETILTISSKAKELQTKIVSPFLYPNYLTL
jgi:hypothetical protein